MISFGENHCSFITKINNIFYNLAPLYGIITLWLSNDINFPGAGVIETRGIFDKISEHNLFHLRDGAPWAKSCFSSLLNINTLVLYLARMQLIFQQNLSFASQQMPFFHAALKHFFSKEKKTYLPAPLLSVVFSTWKHYQTNNQQSKFEFQQLVYKQSAFTSLALLHVSSPVSDLRVPGVV